MNFRMLEEIADHIPGVIIFAKSREEKFIYANREYERLFQVKRAWVIGKTNYDLMAKEVADELLAHDRAVLAEGKSLRFDEEIPIRGEHRIYSCIKCPLRDESGAIYGLAGISIDITERKQQEEALRTSEKRFRDFFAHVPVGMFITSSEGKFLYVNESLCHFLGYKEQELLRLDFAGVTHPDDLGESREASQRLTSGETPDFTLEKRYIRKDGRPVWGRVSATSRFEEGLPRHIGIVEDIDDRKRAEESLRTSEERFRMFADFTYDWEYWINPEGSYVYVSPACEKMSGYGPEHFRDSGQLLALIHPEDRELFAHHLAEHLQESTQFVELEFRIVNRKGEERWLAHACQPIFGKDGSYMGRRASNRDITPRKNAEQQMRLFVDLVDQSNDGLLVVDLRTRRIFVVSEKFWRDLQYTKEEVLAMRPEDISTKPAGFFDRHFRELRKAGPLLVEDHFRRKDGTTFPVEVNVKYVKVGDREYAVAAIRDTSERKRLEQELQKAQKIESIGLLAGGIAHDFNNILTAILGNITLARMFLPSGSKAYERLTVAEQASMRARGLSQQLLTFARGGAPITKIISVPELAQEAVGLALRGSKVRNEYCFPPDLWAVKADESQLNQALNNLALNGVQAMPDGGVLAVAAANASLPDDNTLGLPAGRYVRIDVKDHGAGIPAETQEKIFDPYFTTKERGSGLGLAIAFSIAKRHEGTITVDSTPGGGSTFSLFLPASEEKPTVSKPKKPQEIVRGTGRILVMDDEETVSEVVTEMLRHLGYRGESVRDGAEAVTAYRQALADGEPFDAVITDLTVPAGMGGKETVQRLLEVDPAAKVIVSSGYGNDPIMSDYARHGFQGVIPKPYRLTELGKTLQEVLGSRK